MAKILFTHKFSSKHKEELNSAEFEFDSIPFIGTETKDFDVSLVDARQSSAWIFTSKKAVKSVAKKIDRLTVPEYVFAVGSSTNEGLANIGIRGIMPGQFTAKSLVQKISEYPIDNCTYFHGNMVASDLRKELKDKNCSVNKIEVYETKFTPKSVNVQDYDGVVFMSPSAFDSFCKENNLNDLNTVFCIGSTTAEKVSKSYDRFIVTPDNFTFGDLVKTINQKYKNVIS
ncbi:MAG: uroporphyrinogen-III synthase [Balneola sp.]